jgi:hypothetical protein
MESGERRRLMRRLKDLGFQPKRRTRHGELWSDSLGRVVLLARVTRSDDYRAHRNVEALLRRLTSQS